MTSPPVANLAVLRELGRPGVRRPCGALGALHWPTPILLKTTSILAPAETHTPAPADGRDGDGREPLAGLQVPEHDPAAGLNRRPHAALADHGVRRQRPRLLLKKKEKQGVDGGGVLPGPEAAVLAC